MKSKQSMIHHSSNKFNFETSFFFLTLIKVIFSLTLNINNKHNFSLTLINRILQLLIIEHHSYIFRIFFSKMCFTFSHTFSKSFVFVKFAENFEFDEHSFVFEFHSINRATKTIVHHVICVKKDEKFTNHHVYFVIESEKINLIECYIDNFIEFENQKSESFQLIKIEY